MIKQDFHIHSNYCDGTSSLEEIILEAINKKMDKIGILFHSYTSFDPIPCIDKDKMYEFKEEILKLKEKYKDKIEVYFGVEQDYYSDFYDLGYDYIIGSVHYVKKDDNYISVDDTIEILLDGIKKYYNNDPYLLIEDYFKLESDVVNKTHASIIGHFNVVAKFNKIYKFFDEENERYKKAWKNAIDELLKYDIPFEINTGAIYKGYRDDTYPSLEMINYIKSKGGKLILSSDSHNKESIMYKFNEFESLI